MKYVIYRLHFTAPVHFGATEHGGRLEQTELSYPSDTLFSALCSEWARQGMSEALADFIEQNRRGEVVFSDLLPYREDAAGVQLYLPKPVLLIERDEQPQATSLDDVRQQATARKKLKKLTYSRAGRMAEYLAAMRTGRPFSSEESFGTEGIAVRVNQRGAEPLPYAVSSFSFRADAGMYVIARVETEAQGAVIAGLLTSLGLSGIGGKRSSGYGAFTLVQSAEALAAMAGADAAALCSMLSDEQASWQMCLSSLLSDAAALSAAVGAQYSLRKRGGFLTPEDGAPMKKKNSIYLLAAGSCLPQRLSGRVASLGRSHGHEVLRSGVSLYAGLRV